MEVKADSQKREVPKTPTNPITINDLYEKMKALVGEVSGDPHLVLSKIRGSGGAV